jgi:hypothetical protein
MSDDSNSSLTALYSHISRLYNSGINALTAILFGWITYNGVVINLVANKIFPIYRGIMAIIGTVIILLALYFYLRLFLFGRWMAKIENDLKLRPYIHSLPRFGFFPKINERLGDDPTKWTIMEVISLPAIIIFFIIPFIFLFSGCYL